MKIAIDLNDVIRDFSDNFVKVYLTRYNHEFDTTDFEMWTNDLQSLLPFKNDRAYQNFTYVDYAFELFGKCDTCSKKLARNLNEWINGLSDLEIDEDIDIMIVSPMEYGESINYSYFFVSKLGCNIREVYFPMDSQKIWNKCDVLITANPKLLEGKPENKVSVKIEKDYNANSESTYTFKNLDSFLTNDNIQKIIEDGFYE